MTTRMHAWNLKLKTHYPLFSMLNHYKNNYFFKCKKNIAKLETQIKCDNHKYSKLC